MTGTEGTGHDGILREELARLLDAGGMPDASDALDVLWIARLSGLDPLDWSLLGNGTDPTAAPPPADPVPPAPPADHTAPADPGDPDPPSARLHLPGAAAPARPGGAHAIRVAQPRALPDTLSLTRALRPLRQTVPSARSRILDVAATAAASGDTGLLLPVLRPAAERRFSADLLIDTGTTMAVWHRLADELRMLLARHGAFADVRAWALQTDGPEPTLAPFRRGAQSASPTRRWRQTLADPTGRRAVLVLTDGVGPAWYGSELPDTLADWSGHRPVAALQVLPSRLWHRTALRPAPVRARGTQTGRATVEVRSSGPLPGVARGRAGDADRARIRWLPVLEVAGDWLGPWARLVSGRTTDWVPLRAAALTVVERPGPATRDQEPNRPAAWIERFEEGYSPEAFRLLRLLAAAPLSLPVMRLVQRTMLPSSTPMHLAEIFLSGLLVRRTPAEPGEDPDGVLYDFRDGVREALLDRLTRTESRRVLDQVIDNVSDRVAATLGGVLDFTALVAAVGRSGGLDGVELPEESRAFAEVALMVISGAGGDLEEVAERLTRGRADERAAQRALEEGEKRWWELRGFPRRRRPGPAAAADGRSPVAAADEPSTPEALVERFRERNSPEAYRLLCLLSGAELLTLPVMQLVCRTMVPPTKPEHLDEVLRAGLFVRRTPAVPGQDESTVLYAFRDGVREVLQDQLRRAEAVEKPGGWREVMPRLFSRRRQRVEVVLERQGSRIEFSGDAQTLRQFLHTLRGASRIPPPPPHHVQRDEAAHVRAVLDRGVGTCVIQGARGVGKTTLAAHCAAAVAERFETVRWIRAHNRESLLADLLTLANDLGIFRVKVSSFPAGLLTDIHAHLRDHPGWLLVYDGVTSETFKPLPGDPAGSTSLWLPPEGCGSLLVTLEEGTPWPQERHSKVTLEDFSHEQAMTYLGKALAEHHGGLWFRTAELADVVAVTGTNPRVLAERVSVLTRDRVEVHRYVQSVLESRPEVESFLPSLVWITRDGAFLGTGVAVGPDAVLTTGFLVEADRDRVHRLGRGVGVRVVRSEFVAGAPRLILLRLAEAVLPAAAPAQPGNNAVVAAWFEPSLRSESPRIRLRPAGSTVSFPVSGTALIDGHGRLRSLVASRSGDGAPIDVTPQITGTITNLPRSPVQVREQAAEAARQLETRLFPLFYLSYARTPPARARKGSAEHRFFTDLTSALEELLPVEEPGIGFFDGTLRLGTRWRPAMQRAMARAQVFVPLYSTRYFTSEWCGKEWDAFRRRQKQDRNSVATVPVIWAPTDRSLLPSDARTVMNRHVTSGTLYAREGLTRLQESHPRTYQRRVDRIAELIMEAVRATPLSPCDPGLLDDLDNAFEGDKG